MKYILFAVAFAAALLTSHFSFAQTAMPVIHHRQARQQDRIRSGVHNGSLTPRETAHLDKR